MTIDLYTFLRGIVPVNLLHELEVVRGHTGLLSGQQHQPERGWLCADSAMAPDQLSGLISGPATASYLPSGGGAKWPKCSATGTGASPLARLHHVAPVLMPASRRL